MEISGKVKVIGAEQQVSPTFKKRELVVTTDEQYSSDILIEFVQDKTDLLNSIAVGENVKVSINISGKEWVNPQGETKYFNSIKGWRIEKLQSEPTLGAPIQNTQEKTVYPESTEEEDDTLPF